MIRLRLLGGLGLTDGQGHEVRAVLAQPKRLALLIYLATAQPAGFHRRDTLLALFWPDFDETGARAALSRALHYLRQALGPDVIVGRGDQELGVDRALLSCDLLELEAAVARHDVTAALSLYQGDLLPGFHVDDTAGFGSWIDGERARIRTLVATAAGNGADAADRAGNPEAAVSFARRASELAPYNEAAILDLMRLLDAQGNRSEALLACDAFAQRFRADLGAEPGADVRSAADRIRRGRSDSPAPNRDVPALQFRSDHVERRTSHGRDTRGIGAAGPALRLMPEPEPMEVPALAEPVPIPARPQLVATISRRRPKWVLPALFLGITAAVATVYRFATVRQFPLDPDRLAIAPFQVFDSTLVPWGVGVGEFVSRSLDQTGGLRMVPPSVALRAATGTIDVGSARTFGRATGAGLVLLGSLLRRGGDSVRIDASLVDTRGDRRLGDIEIVGTLARVDLLVDSLSVEIVRALGRAGRAVPFPQSRLSARSLPALKMFLAAEMALRRGAWDSAQAQFRETVRLDSTFSLAWLRLGITTLSIDLAGGPGGGLAGWQYILRASSAGGGLSRHDSMLVTTAVGLASFARRVVPPDSAAARASELLATALEMTRNYPDDPEAWFALGEVRASFLPLMPPRWDKAGAAFITATERDSTFVPAYVEGMKFVFDVEDTVAGLRLVRRFLALNPPGTSRALPMLLDRLFTRPWNAAANNRLLDSLPPEALFRAWDRLWLLTDSVERAIVVARAAVRRPPDPRFIYTAPTVTRRNLASSLAYRGHVDEALALATNEDATWCPWIVPDIAMVGAMSAPIADSAIHAWIAAGPSSGGGAMYAEFWLADHRDTVALATMVHARVPTPPTLAAALALARADTVGAIRLLKSWLPVETDDMYGGIVLARLLKTTGKPAEALRVLRNPPNNDWPTIARVVWRLDRARLEEAQGDPRSAITDYEFVTAVWRSADSALMGVVSEANEGIRRLTAQ